MAIELGKLRVVGGSKVILLRWRSRYLNGKPTRLGVEDVPGTVNRSPLVEDVRPGSNLIVTENIAITAHSFLTDARECLHRIHPRLTPFRPREIYGVHIGRIQITSVLLSGSFSRLLIDIVQSVHTPRRGMKFLQVVDGVDMWYPCVWFLLITAANNLLHGSIDECRAHGATVSLIRRRMCNEPSSDAHLSFHFFNPDPNQASNEACLQDPLEPGKRIKSGRAWHKVAPSFRLYERPSTCQNTVPSVGGRRLACCIYGAKSSSVGRESPTYLVSRRQVYEGHAKDPLARIC